ncbi:DUF1385 domain-containing protein [Candidatus Parcubacteria bacterium]|nr:DUF1385 domain-containing protein [Candidatus Parcubacteria bacterium]
MRGNSYPFGFVLYEQKKVIIGIEDLPSLTKFGIILISMVVLLSIVQTLILQIVLFVLIFSYLIKILYYETSEWHAIEHKLVYSLENNCPLTIDNFKKIPIKHKRCGIWNKLLREPSLKKINMALEAGKEYLNEKDK